MNDYEITIIAAGRCNYYQVREWSENNARITANEIAEQDFDSVEDIILRKL